MMNESKPCVGNSLSRSSILLFIFATHVPQRGRQSKIVILLFLFYLVESRPAMGERKYRCVLTSLVLQTFPTNCDHQGPATPHVKEKKKQNSVKSDMTFERALSCKDSLALKNCRFLTNSRSKERHSV